MPLCPFISAVRPDLGSSTVSLTLGTRTCEAVTVTQNHVCTADRSLQSRVSPGPPYKHRHVPLTVPGLLNCPLPFPVHLSGRVGEGRAEVRCQCPWSRRQKFLAGVRSQKLPPSRNLSCLSSHLAQCWTVGQLG